MKGLKKGREGESSLWIAGLINNIWGDEEEKPSGPDKARLSARLFSRKKTLASWKESAIKAFFFTNGLLAIVVLIGIFAILLYTAIPAFRAIPLKEFFGNKIWDPTSPEKAEYGLLSMIVSTLMCTTGALIIAIRQNDSHILCFRDRVAPGLNFPNSSFNISMKLLTNGKTAFINILLPDPNIGLE